VIDGRRSEKLANVVFATIHDRRGRSILSVRDQNTFDEALRKKRLMTLIHLFLVHRYKADSVHYVTPDRGQPVPDGEDEGHGIFTRGQHRGRARSSWPTCRARATSGSNSTPEHLEPGLLQPSARRPP
jgi:hypothetical protein